MDTVESTTSQVFEALPPAKDSVSSITFLTASLWYWSWVFFKIMNYVVVIIPTIFLNMLQMNFQITLSLSSILTCLAITVSLCYFIVRHKYLTRYSKETLPPLQDSSSHGTRGIDYVEGSRKKRGTDKTKTYLDEFLSAIKVFGYLERPVFHELTRNMTTQRLEADEILYLDEKLGFSIVVEGSVQVYTKIHDKHGSHFEFDQDTDKADKDDILVIKGQHYQLLNEVKSGAALSSLLSTLDLFHTRNTALSSPALPPVSNRASVLARPKPMLHNRLNSRQSSTSTPIEPLSLSPMHDSSSVTQSRGDGYFSSPRLNTSGLQGQPESTVGTPMDHGSFPLYDHSFSELPEVVARPKPSSPKSDFPSTATIAIIPGSAFQRVQARYPKATSHIVTMVLTRMYKVTMNTVHTYLGLIREVFDSEIALNSIHEECKLPSYLYDGVIESYNQQRAEEVDGASMPIFAKSKKRQRKLHRENSSRYVVLANRSKPSHPGDLLSSVPLSRTSDYVKLQGSSVSDETSNLTSGDSQRQLPNEPNSSSSPTLKKSKPKRRENIRNRSFSDEREETEETSLRIAIVENLFKLLGVDENSSNLNMSGISSGQLSGNSSTVGLSSLMSDQSLPINMERNFFETERNKDAAFNSSYSGYRASFPQSSQKFYNTIVHTKPEVAESEISTPNSRRPSHSSSEVNFATVKNAFSKHIEVKYYKPGEIIVEQNGMSPGLFYVIHGGLDIIHKSPKDNEHDVVSKRLYSVKPGGMAGYLSSIVGLRSLVSIKSSKYDGAIVAHISKNDLTRLLDKFYFLQLPIAAKLKSLLPSLIVTIDFALEWCHIPAGGVLCSQGDLANGFHIVLSGRFRVVKNKKMKNEAEDEEDDLGHLIDESNIPRHHQDNDDFEILGEYGHGASIGEVEVLTASRRTNSLIAVRDSETARIPRTLFEMLSLQNPSIMVKVSRIVANRSLEASKRDRTNTLIATTSKSSVVEINNDYKTITILPATNGLPVREFADKLVHALRALDRRVIALDRTSTLSHLGRYAFDERLAQLRLSGYFAYLEEVYQTVVYICDSPLKSSWTSTCISQGDCILLLADAEDYDCAANVGDYERLLLKLKTTARTELCLLHPEPSVFPGSTSIWLKNRIWVQGHHHIHMEVPKQAAPKPHKRKSNMLTDLATKLSTKANPNIKMKFSNVKSRAMNSLIKLNARTNKAENVPVLYKNDFMRLARILSNEAVGLVLGGGGSRGISHVGVVTALEKHGIPVDLIGGTSIGSFVGGLYAKENNIVSIYGMTKKFSRRIGAVWRMLFDLTYPVTSYITGHEFNRGIWKVFGVHEIEDFWIRYFCNSTNITTSTMEIHERGYAWRFIRASMSLAGLLPPITYNGSMLLDGGYLDNLPVMEMKVRGAKHIVAVDVGSVDDRTPMNYGDTLSGFWVLLNRWNPFSKHPNVPNMMDIQLRLAYVASVNALEAAKKMPGVMYLRPPIDDYATLDFMKFDEIYNVGLAYADDTIGRWAKEGKLPKFAGVTDLKSREGDHPKRRFRRNSI